MGTKERWMTTRQHLGAGAYALGAMDPADARHFEAHLEQCPACVAQLREFARIEARLAALAQSYPPGERWLPRPSRALMDRMAGEVAVAWRAVRRRPGYLVAAAAALVLGSSVVTGLRVSGPGPGTAVSAMVGIEEKDWARTSD
jgi:anti-sigma factor RsiW